MFGGPAIAGFLAFRGCLTQRLTESPRCRERRAPTNQGELDAHFGPDGPVAAAARWIGLILTDGDLQQAWPLTDLPFRETLAWAWLDANRQHPMIRGYEQASVVAGLVGRAA